ncbi:MAG TPA: hypothetical protein PLB45_04715, partial [Bacilli bacterium]|nr:hypothetical protein [Bacilli bacterium]
KDNDEESLKYLPEEERNKIIEDDKYNKKIIKEVIIIFSVVIVVMIIGLNAFIYYNKSDLEKNISPVLLNYYQDKYSVKTSINSIDYICLKASYGQEKECSNIIDAVTKDGYHIMSIDGLIGDNRSVDSVKNSYIEYIKSINPDMSLLVNNAILSYKDYYINYNKFEDYINVLPNGYSFNDLYSSNKLNVIDTIIYQGSLNYDNLSSFMNNLSDNSIMFFIGTSSGLPISLTAVSKTGIVNYKISGTSNVYDSVVNYELDRSLNKITSVNVSHVADNSITPLIKTNNINNAYNISYEAGYGNDDTRSTYYLLGFNSEINSNIIEFNSSRELDKSYYSDVYTVTIGTTMYVIGDKNVGIANLSDKSKKCILGICYN